MKLKNQKKKKKKQQQQSNNRTKNMIFIKSRPEGKFKSQLEKRIYLFINKHINKNLEMNINEKKIGKKMIIDLYIPKFNLGIEIQGPRHTSSPEAIKHDYYKKRKSFAEGISLTYIYTETYEVMKTCLYNLRKILLCFDQGLRHAKSK